MMNKAKSYVDSNIKQWGVFLVIPNLNFFVRSWSELTSDTSLIKWKQVRTTININA